MPIIWCLKCQKQHFSFMKWTPGFRHMDSKSKTFIHKLNLTALAPLTILLVEHQALVKHREQLQSLLNSFTAGTDQIHHTYALCPCVTICLSPFFPLLRVPILVYCVNILESLPLEQSLSFECPDFEPLLYLSKMLKYACFNSSFLGLIPLNNFMTQESALVHCIFVQS